MSAITEIYICRFGEKLEDGALQTTGDIVNRDQAERDAHDLCARDPTIDKIAYYSIREDGGHRHLLTYTNPSNARRARREQPRPPKSAPARLRTRRREAPTFWRRVMALFG